MRRNRRSSPSKPLATCGFAHGQVVESASVPPPGFRSRARPARRRRTIQTWTTLQMLQSFVLKMRTQKRRAFLPSVTKKLLRNLPTVTLVVCYSTVSSVFRITHPQRLCRGNSISRVVGQQQNHRSIEVIVKSSGPQNGRERLAIFALVFSWAFSIRTGCCCTGPLLGSWSSKS